MGKYRSLGTMFNRLFRNDLNANFNDIDADILAQKQRVDNLIVSTPQPSEVVDSRGSFSVLLDRLNDSDTKLSDVVTLKRSGCKGDGTDETLKIQGLIDSLSSKGGGVILVGEGVFGFSSLKIKPNVTIKGNGGKLKLIDNVCVNTSTAYYPINNLDGLGGYYENVTIDGIYFDGNGANNTQFSVADGMTIGGENCKVLNCSIINPPDSGIMFSDAKNGVLFNNRISGATDLGIYVNDGDGTGLYENVISHNRITDCMVGGIALKRISQRLIVDSNTIYNCGGGITLENATTTTDFSRNVTISNNRIRKIGYINTGSPKIGIDLRGSDFSIVVNNRIEDVIKYGIIIEGTNHSIVSNNDITYESTADSLLAIGIEMIAREGIGCSNNVIANNIIKDAKYAGLRCSPSVLSRNNIITSNIFGSLNRGMYIGVNAQDNKIEGNIIDGTNYDVQFESGANNNSFIDNLLKHKTMLGNLDWQNKVVYQYFREKIVSVGTSIPTSGSWSLGDEVINIAPTVQGAAGSRYIVEKWKRISTGSNNVLGTDWVECRTLTGQ
jgi:parallel beta-helix repeat protein